MWFDVICAVIVVLSVWRGMIKGFVWQLATIAGIILCFIFAETVSIAVAPMTGLEPPLSRWVSILGLYIVSSFGAFALARMVKGGLEKAKFEDYDRHLGAVFGFIKGATICLIASFFMFTLTESTRETMVHSHSGYASAVLFEKISPVMPAELHKILDPYLEGFDAASIAKHREEHPLQDNDSSDDHSHDHTDSGSYSGDIEQMISGLPAVFGSELRQLVTRSIENTAPEHRPELLDQLSSNLPGVVRQVAEQWKNGKPVFEVNPTTDPDWKQHRAELLREIAGIYTEHLDAQQAIMEEVVYSLHGVPDEVTVAVLEDWHADLSGSGPDPDPSTDMTTSLDSRIARQVSAAGVSINSLSSDLQRRLSVATRH